MEKELLGKLEKGILDGIVGSDFNFGTGRIYRMVIVAGVPCRINFPEDTEPTETTTICENRFETDEGKLWFLRNHGWKMTDPDVNRYSRTYKRPHGC